VTAGEAVVRSWAKPVKLTGHGITLRPLMPADLPGLYAVTPADTFRFYSISPRMASVEAFVTDVTALIGDPSRVLFAVVLEETGQIVGSTSYLEIRPEHRGLEIGYTWYVPAHRGTRVNPACKRLLIGHAIETLGAVRVQIKTGRANLHSQRAIEKLGATYEGVLRANFIRPDGELRDTVYYSILPSEWPKVKAGLDARLQ